MLFYLAPLIGISKIVLHALGGILATAAMSSSVSISMEASISMMILSAVKTQNARSGAKSCDLFYGWIICEREYLISQWHRWAGIEM